MKMVLHKQTLCRKAAAFTSSLELWAFALPLLFVLAAFALSPSPEPQASGQNTAFDVGAAHLPAELTDGKEQDIYFGVVSKKMIKLEGL